MFWRFFKLAAQLNRKVTTENLQNIMSLFFPKHSLMKHFYSICVLLTENENQKDCFPFVMMLHNWNDFVKTWTHFSFFWVIFTLFFFSLYLQSTTCKHWYKHSPHFSVTVVSAPTTKCCVLQGSFNTSHVTVWFGNWKRTLTE